MDQDVHSTPAVEGVDRAAEVAVETTLWCLRRDEVEDAGGCVADFWIEAWALAADEVECCGCGFWDWEGRWDEERITVGFGEVTTLDMTDHVEGFDGAGDLGGLLEVFVRRGDVDLLDWDSEICHDDEVKEIWVWKMFFRAKQIEGSF